VDDAKRIRRFDHSNDAGEQIFRAWVAHHAIDLEAFVSPKLTKFAVSFRTRFRPIFEQSILSARSLNALNQGRSKRMALRSPEIVIGQFEKVF